VRTRPDPHQKEIAAVPLSENEQRQLEAIERALYAEDPKFAAALNSADLRRHVVRRLRRAAALFLVGVVLLVCTFVNVWYGAAGFVVMFVGALGMVTAAKRLSGRNRPPLAALGPDGRPQPRATPSRQHQRQPWRERVEERWRRRWEDRG
jgi:hypothetical protein